MHYRILDGKTWDSFIFRQRDSLRTVCNAPKRQGVYLIYPFTEPLTEDSLLYVGKSGSILQCGELKSEILHGRIQNSRGGMKVTIYNCREELLLLPFSRQKLNAFMAD